MPPSPPRRRLRPAVAPVRRPPPGPIWGPIWGLAMGLWASLATPVLANDFEDFEAARSAYEAADYELARRRFEALVGGDIPRLENRSLTLESHKYLAATYLFLRETPQAEKQFERLLLLEQAYVLDPIGFPHDVQVAFKRVRTRLAEARGRKAKQEAESARQAREAKLAKRREQQNRIDQLRRLASVERVEQRRSRMVAMLPFGIGQFQNDHNTLGVVIAVTSGALLATGVTTYFMHEREVPDSESNRSTKTALRVTNNISAGLLLLVAVVGVIDAQVRFTPSRSVDRRRELPRRLEEPFEFGMGPGGVELRF